MTDTRLDDGLVERLREPYDQRQGRRPELELQAADRLEALTDALERLITMCRRAGPTSDIYWAAVESAEQLLGAIQVWPPEDGGAK
jgi:hypothetical protein